MRHQPVRRLADVPHRMDAEEITFDDLLAGESDGQSMPQTYQQLLAGGFPRGGGLEALSAIQNLQDPDSRFSAVRSTYRGILELQQRTT